MSATAEQLQVPVGTKVRVIQEWGETKVGEEGIVVENEGPLPQEMRLLARLLTGEEFPENAEALYVEFEGRPSPFEEDNGHNGFALVSSQVEVIA